MLTHGRSLKACSAGQLILTGLQYGPAGSLIQIRDVPDDHMKHVCLLYMQATLHCKKQHVTARSNSISKLHAYLPLHITSTAIKFGRPCADRTGSISYSSSGALYQRNTYTGGRRSRLLSKHVP